MFHRLFATTVLAVALATGLVATDRALTSVSVISSAVAQDKGKKDQRETRRTPAL